MKSRLEVTAHQTGPWLVRAGPAVYAVPAVLGRPLVVWHQRRPAVGQLAALPAPPGVETEQWRAFMASLTKALDDDGSAAGHRLPPPIWLRVPLLPAGLVRRVASVLAPLASGRGLAVLGVTGLAGYGHLALATAANPTPLASGGLGPVLALFGLTALWHEFGHAAAIARSGYPPGGIGAGLLFVIPVLYADVTAVGALARADRLRVDLAGVAFQFGLGGVLAVVGLEAGAGTAPVFGAWLALVAVCWSLFPFVRADGYWLVCDLLGVADLAEDPVPIPRRAVRWALAGYRLTNAAFLLGVGFWLPVRYARRGAVVLENLGWDLKRPELLVPLTLVAVAGLALVWLNILRQVVRLVRAALGKGRTTTGG